MFICIPVNEDRGLSSTVCAHFGSTPAFMIVDTDTKTCRVIPNQNRHHGHGMCAPLASIQGEQIDALVLGGIGMGALSKLNAAKIEVYFSEQATVAEVLDAYQAGALRPMRPNMACAHHGHGHP